MRVSRGAILTQRAPAATRVTFPVGLIGYPGKRTFRLLPDPESREFAMLEEEPSGGEEPLSFGVLDPRGIVGGYRVEPTPEERDHLALSPREKASVLVVLNLAAAPEEAWLQLEAPILWNPARGLARQVLRPSPGRGGGVTMGALLAARVAPEVSKETAA